MEKAPAARRARADPKSRNGSEDTRDERARAEREEEEGTRRGAGRTVCSSAGRLLCIRLGLMEPMRPACTWGRAKGERRKRGVKTHRVHFSRTGRA